VYYRHVFEQRIFSNTVLEGVQYHNNNVIDS